MSSVNGEEIEQKVILFVSKQTSNSAAKITPSSNLGSDLGVDGDDAIELLDEYSKAFKVNVDEFPYDEYFGPERAASPLSLIMQMLGKKNGLKSLLVEDLVYGVKSGRLV